MQPSARPVDLGEVIVTASELVLMEAQGNYLRIVTLEREQLIRHRISTAIENLPDDLGMMVHRSYWVAFGHIAGMQRKGGKCFIQMQNGEHVKIAAAREQEVRKTLDAINGLAEQYRHGSSFSG